MSVASGSKISVRHAYFALVFAPPFLKSWLRPCTVCTDYQTTLAEVCYSRGPHLPTSSIGTTKALLYYSYTIQDYESIMWSSLRLTTSHKPTPPKKIKITH